MYKHSLVPDSVRCPEPQSVLSPNPVDVTTCHYCGNRISWVIRLAGERHFCSKGHRERYMRESMHLALKALHWNGSFPQTLMGASTIDLLLAGLAGLASLQPPNAVDSDWQRCVRKAFRTTGHSECASSKAAVAAFGARGPGSLRMSGLMPLEVPQVVPVPVSCGDMVRNDSSFVEPATQKNTRLLQGLLACPVWNDVEPRLGASIALQAPEFRQSSTPFLQHLQPAPPQFQFKSGPDCVPSLRIPPPPPSSTWGVARIRAIEPSNPEDVKISTINHYRDPVPLFCPTPVVLGNWKPSCQGWVPVAAGATGIDLGTVPLHGVALRLTTACLFSSRLAIPDQAAMESIRAAGFGKIESGQLKQARQASGNRGPAVIGGAIRHDPAKSRQEIPLRILQLGRIVYKNPGVFIPRLGMATLRPGIAFADGPATPNRRPIDSKRERFYRRGQAPAIAG